MADYPMQTPYMLGKFLPRGWVLPLTAHCGVHALWTTIIVYSFTNSVFWTTILSCFDFIVHFAMDRIKASPKLLGRFKAINEFEYGWHGDDLIRATLRKNQSDIRYAQERLKDRLRSNKYFWWSLGLDQMVHHVTHYIIIFMILGVL